MSARWPFVLAALLVIPLGLSTRSPAIPWPVFIASHGGDALYALLIYLGARALRPSAPPHHAAAAALGFCFAVETFQLYQAPWLEPIRRSLFGRLVLGSGFVWIDLVRYAGGVLLGLLGERLLTERQATAPRR